MKIAHFVTLSSATTYNPFCSSWHHSGTILLFADYITHSRNADFTGFSAVIKILMPPNIYYFLYTREFPCFPITCTTPNSLNICNVLCANFLVICTFCANSLLVNPSERLSGNSLL